MASHEVSRRSFIQTTAAATVGLGVAGSVQLRAQGANDRIVLAVMGTNGRGAQLAKLLSGMPGSEVGFICDVDDEATAKGVAATAGRQPRAPKTEKDIRRVLEDKNLDAVAIAAPDHWHAPAAILACAAGKDVYVEKPCSHNPLEGELLVAAARRYGRVVQMGNQRRSWPNIVALMKQLREGTLIGRVYFARGWYANTRAAIGVGQPTPVPAGLDYELWQGPAPRREYRDNVIHYNWHWFWNWGTSEACNNGTHEIDMMRWAMGVTFPTRVESAGGRYHFKDDWECPDTQVATFEFEGNRSFIWEGRSCNGFRTEGLPRGVTFHGEGGSVLVDGNGYTVYDQKMKVVSTVEDAAEQSSMNTLGPGDRLDMYHLVNFLDCLRSRKTPNADIEDGHCSATLCHLANISYRAGHTLRCNPGDGHILNDPKAQALWGRSYEKGWEPEGFRA
ncbi:MAG: Gfo/Idh/MocA family oxidoreductase [Vicinamibacterales bacterium]